MSQVNKEDLEKIIKVRSFLAKNLDVLVDNLNVRKQDNKNDSEDLFGFGEEEDDNSAIPWKKDEDRSSLLNVMIKEKESLGLYVSGNPLKNYKDFVDWVNFASGRDDIHLVLVNKIKKIFTKTNRLMLALAISTLDGEYEGIVFPKRAVDLAPRLEAPQLYWVKGSILENRKKKEEDVPGEEGEAQEFVELPKISVEDVALFEEGINNLLKGDASLSINRQEMIDGVQWGEIKTKPREFEDYLNVNGDNDDSQKSDIPTKTLRLAKSIGKEKMMDIKSHLKTEGFEEADVKIKLEVETSSGFKSVKGEFWACSKILRDILSG